MVKGPLAMASVIEWSSRSVVQELSSAELKTYLVTKTLPQYRSEFLKYVDTMAKNEADSFEYRKYAHLYELQGHEGDPRYRTFTTAFSNIGYAGSSFRVAVKEARLMTPITSWQRDAGIKKRHYFKNRPYVVESGERITIWPKKKWLIPGPQKNPRYWGMPYKFIVPVTIDYSESKYKGKHALQNALIDFSHTLGIKIVHDAMRTKSTYALLQARRAARMGYNYSSFKL